MNLATLLKKVLYSVSLELPNCNTNPSAVLVPLRESDGDVYLILTRRASNLPHHAGEVSFPGGRFEPERDANLLDTALREAEEEIGLLRDQVEVVGALKPIVTAVTNFHIYPVVGVVCDRLNYSVQTQEIARVFEVPFSFLLKPDAIEPFEILFDGGVLKNYRFYYDGEVVWGATARIIVQLLDIAGSEIEHFLRVKKNSSAVQS